MADDTPRARPPLRDLVPHGPALSARQRQDILDTAGPSRARYGPRRRAPGPVLPVQVFGATYGLDLVLVSQHPSWDMHELARVDTAAGSVWLCKDSRRGSLEQTIVADVDGLDHLLPEIPLRRFHHDVSVDDRSVGDHLDLTLRYVNADDDPVEIRFVGPAPTGTRRKRNGSTMGHSRGHVLAALDIPAQAFATSASVTIAGEPQVLTKVAGCVPITVALVQTQAGLSTGQWLQEVDEDGVVRTRHASGAEQVWTVEEEDDDGVVLTQRAAWRTLRYHFSRRDDALELARCEVVQSGDPVPACVLHFCPALPDAGVALEAPWRGQWVLDVHGQPGHAFGSVEVRGTADGVLVAVRADKPRWCLDRPLDYGISVSNDRVSVVGGMVALPR